MRRSSTSSNSGGGRRRDSWFSDNDNDRADEDYHQYEHQSTVEDPIFFHSLLFGPSTSPPNPRSTSPSPTVRKFRTPIILPPKPAPLSPPPPSQQHSQTSLQFPPPRTPLTPPASAPASGVQSKRTSPLSSPRSSPPPPPSSPFTLPFTADTVRELLATTRALATGKRRRQRGGRPSRSPASPNTEDSSTSSTSSTGSWSGGTRSWWGGEPPPNQDPSQQPPWSNTSNSTGQSDHHHLWSDEIVSSAVWRAPPGMLTLAGIVLGDPPRATFVIENIDESEPLYSLKLKVAASFIDDRPAWFLPWKHIHLYRVDEPNVAYTDPRLIEEAKACANGVIRNYEPKEVANIIRSTWLKDPKVQIGVCFPPVISVQQSGAQHPLRLLVTVDKTPEETSANRVAYEPSLKEHEEAMLLKSIRVKTKKPKTPMADTDEPGPLEVDPFEFMGPRPSRISEEVPNVAMYGEQNARALVDVGTNSIPAQPYFAPGPMNNSSRPQPNPPSNFTFAPPTGSSAKSKPPSSRFGGSSIGDPSKLEQTASLLGSASGGRGKKKKVGWFQRGNPRRRRNIGILVVVIFLVVIALCITITVLAVKKSKPAQSTIKPKAAKGSSKGLTKSAAGSTPTSRLSPSSTPAAEDGDGDGDDADGDAKSDDDKKVKGDKKKQTGGGDDTDKSDDSNEEGDDQKAGSDGGDETEQTAKKPAGGDDDDDTKPSSADPAVAPATVDPSAAPAAPGEDEADGDAGVAAEVDSAPGLGSTDFTLLAATPVRGNLFQVVSRQSGLCAEYLTATENHMVAEAAKANPKGSDAASGRGLARRESGRAAGRVAAVVSLSPCERIPVAGLSPQLFRATDDEKWMHTRSKMCLDADGTLTSCQMASTPYHISTDQTIRLSRGPSGIGALCAYAATGAGRGASDGLFLSSSASCLPSQLSYQFDLQFF